MPRSTHPAAPSELLGSFGDNELSPECLDGAQRFLRPDGVSIPQVGLPQLGGLDARAAAS